ncbi:biotin--[acetyl-CoA-carboxylase] ligase [Thiotrichales bacterium HSG1]|nr:biotin--[acetyl-CoA-carboxylase] ligase [Thiotrichales bacterium HSG1]
MYRQILKILNNNKKYTIEQLATKLSINIDELCIIIKKLETYGIKLNHPTTNTYQLIEAIELLDAKLIKSKLIDSSVELEIFDVLNSTNKYALDKTDFNKPLICLAEYQTAGYGRQGSNWISPYASGLCLSIRHDYITKSDGLSIALAVTIARVLYNLGIVDVGLKWPNDILWEQRKLAGLLLESIFGKKIVIGIGINVRMPKNDDISQPWVDIATILKKVPSRNTLTIELINNCLETLVNYPKTGLNPFLKDWQFFDLSYGKSVTLYTDDGYIRGTADGIDGRGALRINNQSYICGSLRLTNY